ncbi:LacI family DNA-binding transcriptional regulator [Sphingomonas sp.]|uniref:LacI family DNA-binding transcriptional regulator n=1 Tax=Sphingomonas sp. TaxID=28214 RepID=UPI0035BBFAEF
MSVFTFLHFLIAPVGVTGCDDRLFLLFRLVVLPGTTRGRGSSVTGSVSIKDVAAKAGVSPKTVSRVINGERHVRPEVRAAVQRVVSELDYRPNAFARSLSSSRSYLLGLFIDDPSSGYAADVQRGALLRCRDRSYHLVVEPIDFGSGDWAKAVAESILALRLDGAILTPPACDRADLLDVLDSHALPYVRVSPRGNADRSGLVWMDDVAAAREMTEHLLALGHRDIGFVRGDPEHSVSQRRWDGFQAAMADARIVPREDRVAPGDFSFLSGLAAGERLLGAPERPTAVFASNDDMALGVLMAAVKLGLSVPDSLSIAGFDDAPTSRAAWPQLTTIRQPKAEMAAAAVDILVDPRYRDDVGAGAYRKLLPFELIARGSTARAVY